MAKSRPYRFRFYRANFAKKAKYLFHSVLIFCKRIFLSINAWFNVRWRRITVAMSITLVLFIINFLWLQVDFNLTNEDTLIRWESIFKRTTFLDRYTNNHKLKDSLLLIDFSNAKRLVKRPGIIGDVVETDLQKLKYLVNAIRVQGNSHRYIICDLLFDADEDSLISEIKKTERIVTPYVLTDEGKTEGVLEQGVNSGYVGFPISSGPFSSSLLLKYELFAQGNRKTLPVVMYEELYHTKLKPQQHFFIKGDDVMMSNSGILDLRVRPFQLETTGNNLQVFPIDELLGIISLNDKESFEPLFKGKYVLIGDFKNDLHPTVFGDVPGTLILMNMYYALTKHDNRISLDWILFELSCLFLTCYLLINANGYFDTGWLAKLTKSRYGGLISLTLITTLLLWLISISSYFIFDKHLDVIVLVLLLSIGSFIFKLYEIFKEPLVKFCNNLRNH